MNLKEKIILALKEVYDPEIPINVYDLGLIYDIVVKKESGFVKIVMTLTSPACPTAEFIQDMIRDAVLGVDGVSDVEVELTFDPLWNPDMVLDEAKEELGLVEKKESDLVGVEKTFGGDLSENENKQDLCFNCLISSEKVPLMRGRFKGDDVFICYSCFKKFK